MTAYRRVCDSRHLPRTGISSETLRSAIEHELYLYLSLQYGYLYGGEPGRDPGVLFQRTAAVVVRRRRRTAESGRDRAAAAGSRRRRPGRPLRRAARRGRRGEVEQRRRGGGRRRAGDRAGAVAVPARPTRGHPGRRLKATRLTSAAARHLQRRLPSIHTTRHRNALNNNNNM